MTTIYEVQEQGLVWTVIQVRASGLNREIASYWKQDAAIRVAAALNAAIGDEQIPIAP